LWDISGSVSIALEREAGHPRPPTSVSTHGHFPEDRVVTVALQDFTKPMIVALAHD
jgi:hypothetical protein